ncbi:MAG: hypothetical protein JW751_16530 [Polyangiaceae bacterium]|nr:hypothetical protein [Polyangiaceae bacterium]
MPDRTLRDALLRIEPDHTRHALRSLVRAAQRRQAFTAEELPIGVVSFDGKHISIPSADDRYAQRQTAGKANHVGHRASGPWQPLAALLARAAACPLPDADLRNRFRSRSWPPNPRLAQRAADRGWICTQSTCTLPPSS